ncbi:hypothetical protein NIES2101_28800 [Calothrix sp. HK-06]|nr:hypothetical protein NIES2101_28800 [Calothrix sp. HK-06]
MSNRHQKVYFYIGSNQDVSSHCEPVGYPHLLIALAEGLKALGLEIYANNSYWRLAPDSEQYLFCNNPDIGPDDCSIVIFGDVFHDKATTPEKLFHPNRQYTTVQIEDCDGCVTFSLKPEYRKADFIFKAHFNSKLKFPSNVYPWAFGLSDRIIEATSNNRNFPERQNTLLVNYRHKQFAHSVRKTVDKKVLGQIEEFISLDKFIDNNPPTNAYDYWQWHRTGGRHSPSYYQRLQNSAACAAFGGFFVPAFPKDSASKISRIFKAIYSRFGLQSNRIIQWDSWRLWESLASGCATFHVDFEKYGCQLPVMPENWRHYIGIDLDNIDKSISRIRDEPEILEKVSIQGKLWALEHYSPVATATRFLKSVGHPYANNYTEHNLAVHKYE